MSLVLIVRGEEELGLQRFCPGCRAWWPDTNEYFVRWPSWTSIHCRACVAERRAAAAQAREREQEAAAAELRRADWRRWQGAWRARHRPVAAA